MKHHIEGVKTRMAEKCFDGSFDTGFERGGKFYHIL